MGFDFSDRSEEDGENSRPSLRVKSWILQLLHRRGQSQPSSPRSPDNANGNEDGSTELPVEEATLTQHLLDSGVLTFTGSGGGLQLQISFRDDWWREMNSIRDGDETLVGHLAELIRSDPETLTLEERASAVIVRERGVEIGAWPSEAALLADIALYPTLREWFEPWEQLDGDSRALLLARLRSFLRTCPDCWGRIEVTQPHTVNAGTDVSTVCEECRSVLVRGSF